MPSGPREGAQGTRHSLPQDAGGERWRAPLAGWSPPATPRGGRANQATLPPSSPGPRDSALELGGGGLGWLRPYRPSLPSFHLVFPTYPSFATNPPCIIYGQEKGTETRKEGSRKGGAVHPLTHSQNPGGMGVGQGFGPKPQPPRNPHSRSGTPQIRNRLLLQFPSSSWEQGPTFTVCVCTMCDTHTHIHISCITPWLISPV